MNILERNLFCDVDLLKHLSRNTKLSSTKHRPIRATFHSSWVENLLLPISCFSPLLLCLSSLFIRLRLTLTMQFYFFPVVLLSFTGIVRAEGACSRSCTKFIFFHSFFWLFPCLHYELLFMKCNR